jgi:P4 family phage/plasmid primase-like protien
MLRAGRREDRITMTTGIEYDPDAKAPRFEQFMTEIFNGDAELVDWVWRELGYSLTGDMSEQIIIMGYGEGANGKGKLTAAVKSAFGDYAADTPFSTFELYSRVSIPNDLAALEHKRFVFSSETNDGTRLNEGRLKAISGGDPITARFLNQEFFTFQPECKIHLFVNSKPVVQDDSYGFWRRARLTPFLRQFKGKDDDKKLGEKLKTEAPGILALFVRGCLEWQKRGLDPVPAAIRTATSEYKTESDPLSSYLSECNEDKNNAVKASEFYKSYNTWAETNKLKKHEILSSTEFGKRMSKKYKKAHKRDGDYYFGIRPGEGGIMVADLPEEPPTVKGLGENLNVCEGFEGTFNSKNLLKESRGEELKNPSQPFTTIDNPSQPENQEKTNGDDLDVAVARAEVLIQPSIDNNPYNLSENEKTKILSRWKSLERPVIPLPVGKIIDLEKLLSDPIHLSFHSEQIKAIRAWYAGLKDVISDDNPEG